MSARSWKDHEDGGVESHPTWHAVRYSVRTMHREEWDELTECVDCGATIAPATDRSFALSDDAFLCFECAVRRRGVYDPGEERWVVAPDVSDEPDERRAHP